MSELPKNQILAASARYKNPAYAVAGNEPTCANTKSDQRNYIIALRPCPTELG
jgi:hypothetical protein